ncbi:MAG: DUF2851 family protein [SAR324 cluster bacterium]|nr:DUF2851 family protein [SAR324 cluster bacterium]
MGKEALIAEFVGQREAIMQACWAHQLWASRKLATVDGQAVQVVFQGWLNRGPGPDFMEARVLIGGSEFFGDVEIHIDPAGWRAHRHHQDARYDKVVLHVVLSGAEDQSTVSEAGRRIPIMEALPFLSPRVLEVLQDPEGMLEQYERLPGRCGMRAAMGNLDAMQRVISHAAEVRARQKAERLLPGWEAKSEEQTLFELVFQSLGYRPYAEAFRELAARFPIDALAPHLALPYQRARREVLSRWFGAAGLLEQTKAKCRFAGAGEEYADWQAHWAGLGAAPMPKPIRPAVHRPWNAPERRMVGMFHHLYEMGRDGWLKGWLRFLHDLDALRDQPTLKKSALLMLERCFDTPGMEPWRHMVGFVSPALKQDARLIGNDRIIIVMANAVLPFFLAYARRRKDRELEKLLYRLFIVLPPEAPNQRTRFMERRLLVLDKVPRTLRTQQGLLQIHQDFCTSFAEGCENCGFPDLVSGKGPLGSRS